jgi:hypothetical protein
VRVKSRRSVIALLGLAAVVAWSAPAAAHAVLVSSSPAPGATITSPETVSLTFDDPLLTIGAHIYVLDAQGVEHAAGDSYFPEPTTIQVNVKPLDPGEYSAQWRVVSDDGHPVEGTLAFRVVPATGSAQPSPTGHGAATLTPTTAGKPHLQVYATIGGALAVVALIAVVVLLSRPKDSATRSRRRRRG